MALSDCNIVSGIERDCIDSAGGIKELYITEFENVPQTAITVTSGTVTAMTQTSGKKFWVYKLENEVSELTEGETLSVENGSVFYEQTLSFSLHKMEAKKRNNLRLLAKNRLMVIVLDSNGKYWVVGRTRGAHKVGTNEAKTGLAMGDMNGYTISITGKEPDSMEEVDSTLISALTSV